MAKTIQDYAREVQFIAASMGIPTREAQSAVADYEKLKQALKGNVSAYSFAISIGQ